MKDPSASPLSVCGVVLLRRTGDALLQLRDEIPNISDPGLWVFPGGHAEGEESLEAAARREFLEETCYECADLHVLATYKAHEIGYPGNHEVGFFWSMFDEKQAFQCCEGQELRFVSRLEVSTLPIPGYLPQVWDLALKNSGVKIECR